MRLDKFLASAFSLSRSEVKEKIKKGVVTVNGRTAKDAGMNVSEADSVTLSGKEAEYLKHVYIMLNKPAGVVSATSDKTYKTVTDLLSDKLKKRGLFPVGRLDIDTEGLLILTDDGDFAHRVTSPGKKVDKTYYLKTELPIGEDYTAKLSEGVYIPGGHKTLPAVFCLISEFEAYLTISEGKFHQVKYMLEALGNRVLYLKRVRIGRLDLDESLSPGEYRPFLPSEKVF